MTKGLLITIINDTRRKCQICLSFLTDRELRRHSRLQQQATKTKTNRGSAQLRTSCHNMVILIDYNHFRLQI